jgi:hypothetical protein
MCGNVPQRRSSQMALIPVPKPKNAYNPDRPIGSLLRSQVEHLREAESRLPSRYRHDIDTYTKAIKTEGEAATYIRKVTDAIRDAYAEVEQARRPEHKRAAGRKRVLEIAAVADEREERKRAASRRKTARKKSKSMKNT